MVVLKCLESLLKMGVSRISSDSLLQNLTFFRQVCQVVLDTLKSDNHRIRENQGGGPTVVLIRIFRCSSC